MTDNIPAKTLRLIDAALALQQAGALDQAVSILEQARETTADYAPLHLLLGLAYRDQGRLPEAETSLRRAIQLDPQLTDALQSLGLLLLTRQRDQEAALYLKQHATAVPDNAITLKALAGALHRLGRMEEAVTILADAWQQTAAPAVGITYGRFLIRSQRWPEAEQVLAAVASRYPQPDCLIEYAFALVLREQHEQALAVLQKILTIDPAYDRAWRGLTDAYLPLERYEEALQAAEQAVALNPNHGRNWLALANALLALERPQETTDAARRGTELTSPTDLESLPVLHELHLRQVDGLLMTGEVETAIALLREWIAYYPDENRYLQLLTSLLNALERPAEAWQLLQARDERWLSLRKFETLHRLGRPEEAWAIVQLDVTPEDEDRLHLLANIGYELYQAQNIPAARAIFTQLHTFAPHVSRFASSLAFILTGEGETEWDEALALLRTAQALDDQGFMEGVAEANLGYLLLLQGHYDEAEPLLQTAAQISPEETAVLRLATWQNDHLAADPVAQPLRSIPVPLAAQVNLVALKLAQSQTVEGLALAQTAVQTFPDLPWGYWALGWAYVARGETAAAQQAWQAAGQRSDSPQEQAALQRWLTRLPQ